jgi:Sec-independent protein translocase protein TatA
MGKIGIPELIILFVVVVVVFYMTRTLTNKS